MAANPPDLRGGVFQQALIDGGVNPMAVTAATSAAFHCATPRRWRGPVSYDYTSPQLRLVTPELRKYMFPNFDFHTTQGERRGRIDPQNQPPETVPEPVPYEEPYSPRPDSQPQQPVLGLGDGQYYAGPFIDIRDRRISLNASRYGIAMLMGDEIKGGNLKLKSEWEYGKFRFNDDFVDREWTLTVTKTKPVEVITGITVNEAGQCLTLTKRTVNVWTEGEETEDNTLVFEKMEAVNNGKLEAGQLTFEGSTFYYLGSSPVPPGPLFNIPVADCTP